MKPASLFFRNIRSFPHIQAHFSADTDHKTESLIAADIDVNGKIIRIFTTHLQSVLFKPKDFRNVEIIRNAEDSILEASRSLAKKLKDRPGSSGLPGRHSQKPAGCKSTTRLSFAEISMMFRIPIPIFISGEICRMLLLQNILVSEELIFIFHPRFESTIFFRQRISRSYKA